jgi:hypothetical protein
MTLGGVAERSLRCALCGHEESGFADDDGAETELRRHLRMLHGRVLVNREDKPLKRPGRSVRTFHGVYWKNEVV